MSLFGRKPHDPKPTSAPFREPDPAQDAADEWLSDPKMLALEALADKLLTVPDLTTGAIDWLIALAAEGRQVDAYRAGNPGGEWVIWVQPVAPHYEGHWTVAAWDAYATGQHLTTPPDLCKCVFCQDARQAAARRAQDIQSGNAGEVA